MQPDERSSPDSGDPRTLTPEVVEAVRADQAVHAVRGIRSVMPSETIRDPLLDHLITQHKVPFVLVYY
jgi:hypothetical protein